MWSYLVGPVTVVGAGMVLAGSLRKMDKQRNMDIAKRIEVLLERECKVEKIGDRTVFSHVGYTKHPSVEVYPDKHLFEVLSLLEPSKRCEVEELLKKYAACPVQRNRALFF